MSQFIRTIFDSHGVEYRANFFESGDGKNDLDAHFGLIEGMPFNPDFHLLRPLGIEKRFLIQFDRISGMFSVMNTTTLTS